jgi:hypothetical protein
MRMAAKSRPVRAKNKAADRRFGLTATQKPLYSASDHGRSVALRPGDFAPPQREAGWGPFIDSFIRLNETALAALEVRPEIASGESGAMLRLLPGGRAGAIPLRSAQTGQVAGGFVVRPRFGWSGVGSVLSQTGWHAAPQFLEAPLVPGSGREVPPWVLAGPVLNRLAELARSMRRGYSTAEETLRRPRGRILWDRYRTESLARGSWDALPCRFPDLSADPRLRRILRWTLERIRHDLVRVGAQDTIALVLAQLAQRLIEELGSIVPLQPRRDELLRLSAGNGLLDVAVRRGLEAIGWVVDERGLGGGRELDGLAWQLPLDVLWESYVESIVRGRTAQTGGDVRVARLRGTVFPLHWTDPSHRSLGHLAPDVVVRRGRTVHIYDAKYKAHFAELDEHGWRRFTDDIQEAHRADLHQVLAYASLYDADEIVATLVYPLRRSTWDALKARNRNVSSADLSHCGRSLRVELEGLPFGDAPRERWSQGAGETLEF